MIFKDPNRPCLCLYPYLRSTKYQKLWSLKQVRAWLHLNGIQLFEKRTLCSRNNKARGMFEKEGQTIKVQHESTQYKLFWDPMYFSVAYPIHELKPVVIQCFVKILHWALSNFVKIVPIWWPVCHDKKMFLIYNVYLTRGACMSLTRSMATLSIFDVWLWGVTQSCKKYQLTMFCETYFCTCEKNSLRGHVSL